MRRFHQGGDSFDMQCRIQNGEQAAVTQNLFHAFFLCWLLVHNQLYSQLMEGDLSNSYGQERGRDDSKEQEKFVFVKISFVGASLFEVYFSCLMVQNLKRSFKSESSNNNKVCSSYQLHI